MDGSWRERIGPTLGCGDCLQGFVTAAPGSKIPQALRLDSQNGALRRKAQLPRCRVPGERLRLVVGAGRVTRTEEHR
jgi:hypothetical protein